MLIPSDPVHAFVDYRDVPVPNAPDAVASLPQASLSGFAPSPSARAVVWTPAVAVPWVFD